MSPAWRQRATLVIDPAFAVADVDERVFGSFVEHMGRCVYGGIYEPGHPTAGADGFRGDVLELVRELGVTIVRYPGGNFVSGYDWEDGIGPREARPRRLELAWRSIETNQVGTDEFLAWARAAGARADAGGQHGHARRSTPRGTSWSTATRRAAPSGRTAGGQRHEEPYGVRVWCIGNEMDGPWQIGHKDAVEYGKLANETGKAMRLVDPSIELVVCGSSHSRMPTFGAWEDTVLDLAWDVADHVSLHTYYDPARFADRRGVPRRLARPRPHDRHGGGHRRRRRRPQAQPPARLAQRRRVERLVPDADRGVRAPGEPFVEAPALIEDTYTVTDALVVGCMLITLLRHADRVRMACLAQLVNVIAPIRTRDGGPAWRQTTYFPFRHAARHGRGTVLRVEADAPTYATEGEAEVPVLEATAVHDGDQQLTRVRGQPRHAAAGAAGHAARARRGRGDRAHRAGRRRPGSRQHRRAARPRRPERSRGARGRGRAARQLPPRSWNVLRVGGVG